MMQKALALILFVLIGISAANAQTPDSKGEKAAKVFSWTFNSDGGYLGVQTEEVTRENLSKFDLREVKGVGIESVVDGSPAQSAGLQKGDVIVKVNGDEITSSRKLTRLIGEISPDHQARITVVRNGNERELTVTLGRRPTPKFADGRFFEFNGPAGKFEMPPMAEMPNLTKLPRIESMPLPPDVPDAPMVFSFGSRRQIGVGMTLLTKQLAAHFGVDGGALVTDVRENSPAAKAGIKAGDIITEADGKAVGGDYDLGQVIREKKEGSVTLTIVRDRNRQTVTVMPEEVKGGFDGLFEFSTPNVPDGPPSPGVFKLTRPITPGAPLPLNQLLIPGRVI